MHDILTIFAQLVEESRPDLASVVFGEVGIIERYMNTRNEGVIEGADAVSFQEVNALAVLHCSEEACPTIRKYRDDFWGQSCVEEKAIRCCRHT